MSSCQIFYHSTIPSPVVIYVHGTNNYACRYGCWVCVCVGGGGGGRGSVGGANKSCSDSRNAKTGTSFLPFYIISYLVLPTWSLFFFKKFLGAGHKANKKQKKRVK